MNRSRLYLFLLLLISVPALAFVLSILWQAGEFRTLDPVFPETCEQIGGVASSEDITIDPLTRVAFISGDDRRTESRGHLYAYFLEADGGGPIPLTETLPFEFHPHGISFVRESNGAMYLFAVNHRPTGSTIERFRWLDGQLIHERTFRDPLMHSPNDVAALSSREFFVTVEGRAQGRIGKMLESWLQLGRGTVVFHDSSNARVAASGFSFANGIQLSADQGLLYVAATAARTITVLQRSDENLLQLEQVLDMGTGVDNLEVGLRGTLWVAAHPKLLRFLWYMGGAGRRAPSEVFRIRVFEQTLYERVPFFVDPTGQLLSASSVAAYDSGRLLIGSVADPYFLDCRVETNP